MDWLTNPNDMIDGGNVEDGKELAVEDAYAAPANDKTHNCSLA